MSLTQPVGLLLSSVVTLLLYRVCVCVCGHLLHVPAELYTCINTHIHTQATSEQQLASCGGVAEESSSFSLSCLSSCCNAVET